MYKAEKNRCQKCKLRSQCTGGEAGGSVIRYDRQDALDFAFPPEASACPPVDLWRTGQSLAGRDLPMAKAHLKTEKAKRTIKQRKTCAETIFAEAKNSHGLRRAICKGLDWIK